MLDTKGFVASWNSGAARIKGYHADEIIGAHFSKFYTPEDREAGLPERALQTAEHEGRFVREGWRVRKDGSRFWASVVIDPIRSDDGALIGFAKVTRDVTERLEAERALEQTREALFQSQKLEAIGQLTGGVAHDFNNLLSAAMGSLELIGKRLPPDDERLRALHENAFAGLKRRSSLTQRMLAFARRQDLKFEVLPVSIAGEGLHRPCRKLYGLRELGIVWSKRRVRSDYSGERVNSRHDGRGRRLSNHLAFVCKTAEHDLRQFAVKACGLLFESRTVQRVGTLRLFFARYSIQPYDP
jgi:PAS domain S-box-containing protein